MKYAISLLTSIITFSAIAATNTDEVVIMKNATSCHVTSSGGHVTGNASYVGTFSQDGDDYSSIVPGTWGEVPLLRKNGRQYIVIDNDMAADRFSFDYAGENYILGYENSTYCKHNTIPTCLTISKVNPCA